MSTSTSDSVFGMGTCVNGEKKTNQKPCQFELEKERDVDRPQKGNGRRVVLLVWVEEKIPSSFFQKRRVQPQNCSQKKVFLMQDLALKCPKCPHHHQPH